MLRTGGGRDAKHACKIPVRIGPGIGGLRFWVLHAENLHDRDRLFQVESQPCNWLITICRRSMYSFLFSKAFNQFRNGPCTGFDASGLARRHAQSRMRLAKVVINEIERNRSFKVSPGERGLRRRGRSSLMLKR